MTKSNELVNTDDPEPFPGSVDEQPIPRGGDGKVLGRKILWRNVGLFFFFLNLIPLSSNRYEKPLNVVNSTVFLSAMRCSSGEVRFACGMSERVHKNTQESGHLFQAGRSQ